MIVRNGVDLIETQRVQRAVDRFGRRFLDRVFTPSELDLCRDRVASLAARWAAKEAVAKAFRTGIGDVSFREIEILHGPRREPVLLLHGAAAHLAQTHGLTEWSISLSHTATHAIAFVTAIGSGPE
jgi:holo-[acyl-carrier protein] synthase